MKVIEIKKLSNGSHRNMSGNNLIIPKGWAVIPDDMETPNFPFGEIETKVIDGVTTVTKWTPLDIPESETTAQPITIEQRVSALESAMLELVLGGAE